MAFGTGGAAEHDAQRDAAPSELLAEARAWLIELVEEGVDGYPRAATLTAPIERRADDERDGEAAVSAPVAATTSDAAAETAPAAAAELPGPATPALIPAAPALSAERPTLAEVREALGDCRRCALAEGRTHIVFGDGNPDAEILFIGEGPGENEDLQGLPFVGRAGDLLTQMIEKGMGIPRAEVYICNIVKCRPPNNRNPLPPEVSACRPFLDGQIDAVRPKVIVTLGKPAASLLLGRDVAITRVRGQWHEYRGIPLMPTLHPAFVLRQYTPENRRAVWDDLKAALARARDGR